MHQVVLVVHKEVTASKSPSARNLHFTAEDGKSGRVCLNPTFHSFTASQSNIFHLRVIGPPHLITRPSPAPYMLLERSRAAKVAAPPHSVVLMSAAADTATGRHRNVQRRPLDRSAGRGAAPEGVLVNTDGCSSRYCSSPPAKAGL